MTEYGNYQNRIQQVETSQNEATSANSDVSKSNIVKSKEDDQKTSKVSLEILSSSEDTPLSSKLQDKITISGNFNEKTDSIRANVLSTTNGINGYEHLNSNTMQGKIQGEEGIEEQAATKDPSILNRIKNMNEDELEDALGNPKFDNYTDEILTRLENLSVEVKEVKNEFANIYEKETKISHQETEQSQQLNSNIAILLKSLKADLKDMVVDSPDGKGFEGLSQTTNLTNQNVKFLIKETSTIVVAQDQAKNYKKGQKVEFKSDQGVEIIKLKHVVILAKEQETQLNEFIESVNSNPQSFDQFFRLYSASLTQLPTDPVEKKKDKTEDRLVTTSQTKGFEPTRVTKQIVVDNAAKINKNRGDKIDTPSLISLSSVQWKERRKSLLKEIKLQQEQIKSEISKHERLVEETNKNGLKLEIKASRDDVDHFKNGNLMLNNEFKENALKEYLKLVKNMDQPEPLRAQFKELVVSFHKFNKIVENGDQYPAKLVSEITAHKKEVLNMIQSMLRSTGGVANVRKGLNSRSH